ncbi:PREDICTED: nucleoporin Nup37 [Dufourea novaeangliae]|uniref:Nucleoporin Nup37 n=1 Tax=Dufourea novaeangliae TaxID=178035 RepID=A0A154PQ12_DUFNO|nr:PREDICTED: nucleoporin Nup37 [Dufourea novaeangliae]KZC13807.1 Nucleoporin Nup37 [Dufourea novaeangliae]
MDEALTVPPTFQLHFSKQIYCVELSQYEWSRHLICIALAEEIVIGTIKFQEEDETVEDIAYNPLRTFRHDTRPHAIAWSPETSLSVVPKVLMFCIAGADFRIRLYTSNMTDDTVCEMEGHKDYINSICYETEGEILASASDDHTCKLWAVKEDEKCISTFYLTSPGMTIRFHPEKPGKFLVGEKNGQIHMYDVRSQQAIMSLDADIVPLMSIDWGSNPFKIAGIAAGKLLLWDISNLSLPQESGPLHIEGGLIVKFSPVYDHLVATIGRPDNLLKIRNVKSDQEILCGQVKLIGGITWHYSEPYICAASDREIRFWKVSLN